MLSSRFAGPSIFPSAVNPPLKGIYSIAHAPASGSDGQSGPASACAVPELFRDQPIVGDLQHDAIFSNVRDLIGRGVTVSREEARAVNLHEALTLQPFAQLVRQNRRAG